MEWEGLLRKPKKYINSTWKGCLIGFVQVVKTARFDDDGGLRETSMVNVYDVDGDLMETYIPSTYSLEPYAQSDYILCSIQDRKEINVQK